MIKVNKLRPTTATTLLKLNLVMKLHLMRVVAIATMVVVTARAVEVTLMVVKTRRKLAI